MKQKLTLGQLQEYFGEKRPEKIVYCTLNHGYANGPQTPYILSAACGFDLTFKEIIISEISAKIYLTNIENKMGLVRVKYAEIDSDTLETYSILTVFCCGNNDTLQEVSFNFLLA